MYNNYEYGSKEYRQRELNKKEETFRLMVLGFRSTENDVKFYGTDAIGMQVSRLKDAYDDYVTYKEYAESKEAEESEEEWTNILVNIVNTANSAQV